MNFRKSLTLFAFNPNVYKNASFKKFILKSKNWILILKDFGFSDIVIEFQWVYFLIYIYILKLMEL